MKKQRLSAELEKLLKSISTQETVSSDTEIKTWLMAATLQIWAGNKALSQDYIDALPAFLGESYTAAQVITALDCAGEPGRTLQIPTFF